MKFDVRFPTAVFLGPTLPEAEARAILPEANYYPPAKVGDIYRLVDAGVSRILIIDGVFHSAVPVWPRELLSALDLGIEVYGAASMGALRAAELHVFGMVGVGTIFEWFRDGVIDADDEVAMMHGDESSGYRPISEPLVNIRATLSAAVERGVLSAEGGEEVLAWAASTFYAERSYPRLIQEAAAGWDDEAAARFAVFVRDNKINLKARDAIALLRMVTRCAICQRRRSSKSSELARACCNPTSSEG